MFGRDRSADGRGDYVRKDRSADGAERVAARVAGGGEEACVAHAAGLGGLLDEGTRSSGGGEGREGRTGGCDGRSGGWTGMVEVYIG